MIITVFLDMTPCWLVIYPEERAAPTLMLVAKKYFLF
jgi:hypothetical protein